MSSRCLVVGLGNPILGDDGVGWRVADEVEREIGGSAPHVEIQRASLGGLSLMERLVGFDRAIIVDAIHSGQRPIGAVRLFADDDLPQPSAGYTTAAHDTSFRTALDVGRTLGAALPESVSIVGIEISQNFEFSDQLTDAVAAAIPTATSVVVAVLEQEKEHHGVP